MTGTHDVLLVEDEQELREELAEMLAANGLQVAQAGSVEDALHQLRLHHHPLVLLADYRLGPANAGHLLAGLADDPALHAKLAGILVMSADVPNLREMADGPWAPMLQTIVKPFRIDEVLAALETARAAPRVTIGGGQRIH